MSRGDAKAPRGRSRYGFTVLELMLALVVSAGVLLGARLLIEVLGEGATRITAASRQQDRAANAERLLRSLVAQVELNPQTEASFTGDRHEARFSSWCPVPAGWWERCAVTLRVTRSGSQPVLLVIQAGHPALNVLQAKRALALRYLADARSGGSWFEQWGEGTTAPLAIGIVQDADTLMLRIGERG